MAADVSLKKRFTFKLTANVVAVLLGLVTMAFVPRALGPESFGRFEFVTNNFKLILDTLALQLPVAYFNWVSRKGHKEETDAATGVTLWFSLAMTGGFALFIGAATLGGFHRFLWPEIEPVYLWESLAFTLAVFLYQLLVFLSDGKSLTVGLEKIRLLQNVLKSAVLVGLVLAGLMNLHAYFWGQIAVIAVTIILSAVWLSRQGACSPAALRPWRFPREELARYGRFVWEYARPLTLLMAGGFLFLYFDRWFLQLIGGSVEQGYFGLSDRLGQIAFVFTSAMTPLLTREFAFAHEERDAERLNRLFERIKLFLFIATVTSCFLSVQSTTIVKLVGGGKFSGAVVPIAIMALYPIHQTFGQLSGGLLMATGQTGLYSRIGLAVMVLSVPVTYFLVAPAGYPVPGLALGATGLAAKMVAVQFLATNVQLFCNTRYLGISYRKWLLYQLAMIPFVYLVAWGVSEGASLLMPSLSPDAGGLLSVGISLAGTGVAYCAAIVLVVLAFPRMAGLGREELSFKFRFSSLVGR